MSYESPVFHPAANLFPEMRADEYQALKEDIRKNGLRSPIVFWRGQLIDGRHRIRACEELGIDWNFYAEETGADKDPVTEALSLNLHRRHLSPSQLSMVADKVRDIYDEEGRAAQSAGGGDKKSAKAKEKSVQENLPEPKKPAQQSRDKAAEAVGVSGKLADAAKKVRTKGTPELQKAVEAGEVAVTAAALVADLPQEKQSEIVANDEVKQAAADIRDEKKRAAAAAKGADDVAVQALRSAANPLCVIQKVIADFSQEQLTGLYLLIQGLLDT